MKEERETDTMHSMTGFYKAAFELRQRLLVKRAEEIVKRIQTLGVVPSRKPNDPKGLPPVIPPNNTPGVDGTLGGEQVRDVGFATKEIVSGTGSGPAIGNDDMSTARN